MLITVSARYQSLLFLSLGLWVVVLCAPWTNESGWWEDEDCCWNSTFVFDFLGWKFCMSRSLFRYESLTFEACSVVFFLKRGDGDESMFWIIIDFWLPLLLRGSGLASDLLIYLSVSSFKLSLLLLFKLFVDIWDGVLSRISGSLSWLWFWSLMNWVNALSMTALILDGCIDLTLTSFNLCPIISLSFWI